MELILKKDNKTLEFVSGSQEVNVNDDLVQIISVMPEMPLSVNESLWVEFGQNGTVAHTLPLFGKGRYTTDIPQAMIDLGGEWEFQILRRRYATSEHEGGFKQTASNKGAFTIGEGVKTVDGTLITTAMLTTLYREVLEDKAIIKEQVAEATTQAETAAEHAESAAASASTAQENAAIAGSYATAAEVSAQSILPKLDAAETAAAAASESAANAMASAERAEGAAVAAESAADAAVEKVSDLEKDIALLNTALMQGGIIYKAETETAYNERITAGGLNVLDGSLAKLEKVVGSTVKCNNLIDIPENFTWTTIYEKRKFELPAGTYTISCSSYEQGGAVPPHIRVLGVNNSDDIWTRVDKVYTKSFAGGEYTVYFYSADNATNSVGVTSTINKLMLNEGETALPFEPYFAGLKNASFAGIESTGRNLFNESELLQYSDILIDAYKGESCYKIIPNTVHHRIPFKAKAGDRINYSIEIAVPNKSSITVMLEDADNKDTDWVQDINYTDSDGYYRKYTRSLTLKKDCAYINFKCYSIASANLYYIKNIMFNIGTTALPYEPYTSNTLNFPKTELGEWDSIDLEKQKVVRGTKTIVYNGTENWTVSDATYNTYKVNIYPDVSYSQTQVIHNNAPFKVIAKGGNSSTGYSILEIHDNSFASVDELKSYLASNPLTVAYRLFNVVETPFTDGNEYKAWANGTERVLGNDNAEYGVKNTLSQNYIVVKE